MRFGILAAGVIALIIALTQPLLSAVSPADDIARLINELGSEEYAVREAASEQLTRIGLAAFSALEAAANHPDREVRYRSQRVLGVIRRHDSERRLEAFLSGKDDGDDYPLPGWNRFSKTYDDGSEQRKLFVEMQRADGELMRAMEENARRAAEMLTIRLLQGQQAQQANPQSVSLGQMAASLFVAAEPDITLPGPAISILFGQCFQPAIREVIDSGSRREIPRKMLAAIITRSDDLTALQAMNVAMQFKLSEGLIPAARILKNHDGIRSAAYAQHALIAIAKLGDASQLSLVDNEKLMNDTTQVAQFRENDSTYIVQLRDVALATAIVLTKQDLKAYFDVPRNQPLIDPQMIFLNPRLVGFASDERRAAVFAKWEKYKAEQPVPAP